MAFCLTHINPPLPIWIFKGCHFKMCFLLIFAPLFLSMFLEINWLPLLADTCFLPMPLHKCHWQISHGSSVAQAVGRVVDIRWVCITSVWNIKRSHPHHRQNLLWQNLARCKAKHILCSLKDPKDLFLLQVSHSCNLFLLKEEEQEVTSGQKGFARSGHPYETYSSRDTLRYPSQFSNSSRERKPASDPKQETDLSSWIKESEGFPLSVKGILVHWPGLLFLLNRVFYHLENYQMLRSGRSNC